MYVRRGVPACKSYPSPPKKKKTPRQQHPNASPPSPALQAPSQDALAARAPAPAPIPVVDIPSKRDVSSAFDAVNLNVDGDAGVTMTFVESLDDDEDEEED